MECYISHNQDNNYNNYQFNKNNIAMETVETITN